MTKTRKLKSVSIAIMLLLSLTLSTVAYAQPAQPMVVFGVVYIDTVPAGAGVAVYAKDGTTDIDDCLTSETSTYGLFLTGPVEDTLIDIYVEDELVETVSLEYGVAPFELDLYVTGGAPEPTNLAPVADAGGPYEGVENEDVIFDGSGSSDSDGTIESYVWTFGEGVTTATGVSSMHIYHDAGIYTVTLTVTDDEGATDIDSTTATITEPGAQPANIDPVADAGGPYSGEIGLAISFDGSGSTDDGTIVTWEWDFDDGETGTGETTSHSYTTAGTYTVILTVTDDEAATDSDTVTVTVSEIVAGEGFTIDYVTKDDVPVVTIEYDDELTVFGSGVTGGADVILYWNYMRSDCILNDTIEGNPDGTFDCTIDIPSDIAGDHYLWAKDEYTGVSTRYQVALHMVPRIKMSPSSGLYKDKVTIKGYGFSEEEDVTVTLDFGLGDDNPTTSPLVPETDELGYWDATFKVPEVDYGEDYTVSAVDADDESTTKTFTVGASIELDIEEGPVGTVVEISGEGFTEDVEIDTGMITMDGIVCYVMDEDTVDDGKFTVDVVVPSVSKTDEYEFTVNDGTYEVTADFEVLGLAEIEIDPKFGVQGTSVQIKGYNFTAESGEDVSVELWNEEGYVTDIKDFETESDGEFSGKFTIPARASGVYTIKAIMDDFNIDGEESFRIGLMIVILTPDSGPTGTLVTLSGTGFTEGENWNATFGDVVIVEGDDGDVDDDSNLELDDEIPTLYVPTVATGTYMITIMDIEAEILVETEFTVTESTTVEFDPASSPNGYNITISGNYFAAQEDCSIDFELYNVTSDGKIDEDWDMKVIQSYDGEDETAVLDEDGNFTAWWDFNDGDIDLSVGTYFINITDDEDLFLQVEFNVVPKTSDIGPRKASFSIGETVAFNVESSFAQEESYIKIWDPSGALYWRTDDFDADMWLKVGTIERILYADQVAGGNPLMLLDDAPLGTWSWTWYDDDADELDDGVFTVEAAEADLIAGQVTDLANEITELANMLTDVSDSFEGVQDDMADIAAIAQQAVTAAQQAADAVNSVAVTAGEASVAADNAAEAANAAMEAAKSLNNLVYGAIAASLVAALAAIVSLMQISKRIAG